MNKISVTSENAVVHLKLRERGNLCSILWKHRQYDKDEEIWISFPFDECSSDNIESIRSLVEEGVVDVMSSFEKESMQSFLIDRSLAEASIKFNFKLIMSVYMIDENKFEALVDVNIR